MNIQPLRKNSEHIVFPNPQATGSIPVEVTSAFLSQSLQVGPHAVSQHFDRPVYTTCTPTTAPDGAGEGP